MRNKLLTLFVGALSITYTTIYGYYIINYVIPQSDVKELDHTTCLEELKKSEDEKTRWFNRYNYQINKE